MGLYDNFQKEQHRLADVEKNRNTSTFGDVVDLAQSGTLSAAGGAAEFLGAEKLGQSLKDWSAEQYETLTPEMRHSMSKQLINEDFSIGEGAKDWRFWLGNVAQLTGQMATTLIPGGAVGVGARALGAGAKLVKGASTVATGATNVAVAGGMQGQALEDDINNLDIETLKQSPLFREKAIQYADSGMNPQEAILRAQNDIAKEASQKVMYDPTLMGVNAFAGMVGEAAMPTILKGALGKTIKGNIAKGFALEGSQEAVQGGLGQYISNIAANDVGLERDLMDGVYVAALNEGLIGGALGGGAGGVGGGFNALNKRFSTQEKVEETITQPREDLIRAGFDREQADAKIREMAENAAIKMGHDANEAKDIADKAMAAATGSGPTTKQQIEELIRKGQQEDTTRFKEADFSGLTLPNPQEFGLSPEDAELLSDPPPELFDVHGRFNKKAPRELMQRYQMLSNSESGIAYLKAEGDFRLETAKRAPNDYRRELMEEQQAGGSMDDMTAQFDQDMAAQQQPVTTQAQAAPRETGIEPTPVETSVEMPSISSSIMNGEVGAIDYEQINANNFNEGVQQAFDISPEAVRQLVDLYESGDVSQTAVIGRLNDIINSTRKQEDQLSPSLQEQQMRQMSDQERAARPEQPQPQGRAGRRFQYQQAQAGRAEAQPKPERDITPQQQQLSQAPQANGIEFDRWSDYDAEVAQPVGEKIKQPPIIPQEQDTVRSPQQTQPDVDVSSLTPQQKVDYYRDRGTTFGTLGEKPELGKRTVKGASQRITKKKSKVLSGELNAIYDRIKQADPDHPIINEEFDYIPNSAMADAFSKLKPTKKKPTPDEQVSRVWDLADAGRITEEQAEALVDEIQGTEIQPEAVSEIAPTTQATESDVVAPKLKLKKEKAAAPTTAAEVAAAAKQTNTDPSEAQIEADNYKKGKVQVHGLTIAIENPKGSTRSGTDPDGNEWSITMNHHYGDIKGVKGADGDDMDIFIGDKPESKMVYVIDQVDPKTKFFDEHKVMMGFTKISDAKKAYKSNYADDWKGFGQLTAVKLDAFKTWIKDGNTTKPYSDKVKIEPDYYARDQGIKKKKEQWKAEYNRKPESKHVKAYKKQMTSDYFSPNSDSFTQWMFKREMDFLGLYNASKNPMPEHLMDKFTKHIEHYVETNEIVETPKDVDVLTREITKEIVKRQSKSDAKSGVELIKLSKIKDAIKEIGNVTQADLDKFTADADAVLNPVKKIATPKMEELGRVNEIKKLKSDAQKDIEVAKLLTKTERTNATSHLKYIIDKLEAIEFNWKEKDTVKSLYSEKNLREFDLMVGEDNADAAYQRLERLHQEVGSDNFREGIIPLRQLKNGTLNTLSVIKRKSDYKPVIQKSLQKYRNLWESVRDREPTPPKGTKDSVTSTDDLINKISSKAYSKGESNVSSTTGNLEQNGGTTTDTLDQVISDDDRRKRLREQDRDITRQVGAGRTKRPRSGGVPSTSPLDVGAEANQRVDDNNGERKSEVGVTGSADPRGNDSDVSDRTSINDDERNQLVPEQVSERTELTRAEQQAEADKVKVKFNDEKNIAQTLPLLSPEQITDVVATERRLFGEKKKGMMFTNGTGTGKTYTGNGVAKRVLQKGGSVLVVAPNGTISGWQASAKDLNFSYTKLKDKSTGAGDDKAIITTYQNFSDNQVLLEDKFDLVIYDESHKLMANMQGDSTKATAYHYAITGKDNKSRGVLKYAPELSKLDADIKKLLVSEEKKSNKIHYHEAAALPRFKRRRAALIKKSETFDAKFKKLESKAPTKALFLSATPFSGHKSVFYGDGYLFDTNEGYKESGAYNSGNPTQQFLAKNFGYRMKYNKANQPGAEVDVGLLEREWADEMFESGAMVGRVLNLSHDYSRQFAQVEAGVGSQVDEMYNTINHKDYPELSKALQTWRKNGTDRQLAEALRVRGSLDRIDEHLKLGRKVVVFHQRMNMAISSPIPTTGSPEVMAEVTKLRKEAPHLLNLNFAGLTAAPQQIIEHFGSDRVALFNGENTKERNGHLKEFNKDGGTKDIIVISKDAGKEGLSAHDITGQSQRVLIVTNTPQSPADAIQMEGRIYRFGLQSNAIIEYPTVQTNFEKIAFRDVVSTRTATAENLAMGGQARYLRDSFRDGYMEPFTEMPNATQGTGGKEGDRNTTTVTPFDRAKTYYYKRAAKTSKTKAQEGADYFATPEPIGFSMVGMAGLLPGEKALEPSAGHGAIARWFPESVTSVAIEQSSELIGELSLVTDGDVRHQDFEDLKIVNKFDAVTMNPPFGKGGSLAIQHINKATKHLNDGGRVVAIYPQGSMADKRFDKWYAEQSDVYLVGDIKLPGITFKRAGTGVATRILVLDKDKGGKSVYQGQVNQDMSNITDPNELFERVNNLEMPVRPDVSIQPSEVGLNYSTNKDGQAIAELSSFNSSGPAYLIGKRELKKLTEKYFGEVKTNVGYWNDTVYVFDNETDRNKFAKAVMEQYGREYKRERDHDTTSFKDSEEVLFRKDIETGRNYPIVLPGHALTKDEAIHFINKFKREYNGNIPLDIIAFENNYDAFQDRANSAGSIYGAYYAKSQKVIIIADRHGSGERTTGTPYYGKPNSSLRETLRHELLGHFALNTFSPSDKKAFLEKITETRKNPSFKKIWQYVDKYYPKSSTDVKAEEAFSYMAEQEPNALGKAWDSLVSFLLGLLRKIGLVDGPLSKSEIYATINRIEQGIKKGTIKQQNFPHSDESLFKKAGDPPSVKSVEKAMNAALDKYKGFASVNVAVVKNQSALKAISNVEISENDAVKSAYMPASDTVILVADNLTDIEEARTALRAEIMANKGLMESLSIEESELLTSKIIKMGNMSAMKDIWSEVERTHANAPDPIKVEAVIQRIAQSESGMYNTIMPIVMGSMNRSGLLGQKPTLNEVKQLVNGIDQSIRTASGRKRRQSDVRFAKSNAQETIQPTMTADEALNQKSSAVFSAVKRAINNVPGVDAFKQNKYGLLTLRQLSELSDRKFDGRIGQYVSTVNKMLVVQNTLAEKVAHITDDVSKWSRKNKDASQELFHVMHESTLIGADPSKGYEDMTELLEKEEARIERRLQSSGAEANVELTNRLNEVRAAIKNEPLRQQKHAIMAKKYKTLTPEAKEHFVIMRDHYIGQRNQMAAALIANIERAVENEKVRAEMLRTIRFDQERAEKEIYFPLARFGQYWIDFADEHGERRFMMYETQAEMEVARDGLAKAGYKVSFGQKLEESQALTGASMGFVGDVINNIKEMSLNDKAKDNLSDMVYQLYLQSMPERSIRRAFIHRKGVAGFDQDAIRAMADQGIKQSRQQARLAHLDDLDAQMEDIRVDAEITNDVEKDRIYNEMTKRHEWVKNPSRSAWAQKMTSLGFVWLLGATPAAAIVNLTQNLQVAVPVIGSEFGVGKTTQAMMKATNQFIGSVSKAIKAGGRKGVLYYGLSDSDEKQAIQYGMDVGALDVTQAADLMGLAENPSATYSGTWNKAMNVIGWAFHHAEVMNREVAFMTAYRLHKAKNGNHDAATEYAVQATWDSHFDYGSLNRARFMQSDLAAVALQFKQYSQSMSYYLATNMFKAIKGESKEVKTRARRQLTWTLAITFGIGGMAALPLSAIAMAVNAAHDAFGDDEEPWDAETEMKGMLTDYFGDETSKLLWYGTIPSISGRISLNDLWIREPNRDLRADQTYLHYIQQALGPVIGGIGMQVVRGAGDVAQGEFARGAEGMSPKAVRDLLRTARYINEGGIVNRQGDAIVEDLSFLELAGQMSGFVPSRSVIQYDQNNALKGYEMTAIKRRSRLLTTYWQAYRTKDTEAMHNLNRKIKNYNQSRWGKANPITAQTIRQSIKRRENNLNRSSGGLLVNKNYERLIQESAYWN